MNKEEIQEFNRRRQVIVKTISDMVEQAKSLLADANQIARDSGMELQFANMLSEIQNNINNTWYASDTSHC